MTRRRIELNRDVIAAAALAVVDRNGGAAFSMRSVAAELGSSPMSLYHHVADRAELVSLMVDAAMREEPMPTHASGGWRDDLWHLAQWLNGSATRHPNLGALVVEMKRATAAMFAFGESWVSLWHESGLPETVALEAAIASLSSVVAVVNNPPAPITVPAIADDELTGSPALEKAMRLSPNSSALFELVVRGTIEGIEARARATEGRTS